MVLFKGRLVKVRVSGIVIGLIGICIMFLSGSDGYWEGWLGNLGVALFGIGLLAFYFGVSGEDDPSWKSDKEKKIEELESRIRKLEKGN